MIRTFPTLAEMLPSPPIADLGHWVWMLVAFLIIGAALLHGINEGRKLFARSPSQDDRLAKLEEKINGKADASAVGHMHTEIIPRHTLEARLVSIDGDVSGVREEIHHGGERMHEVMDSLKTLIEDRFKELDRKRSVSIGNLHEHLSNVRDRVSTMEASVKAVVQTQHAMDSKIDRLKRGD
jgi:hypothetical protein